jgi:dipeptidyl aminopeptidase/acylaminoacyl peptidase
VSLFGASNLQTILSQSTEFGLRMRVPALQLLLGDVPEQKPALAKLASPVAHLDAHDPPLLLIHGDADPQMPPQQSQEFAKAYEAMKLPVTLIVLPGSKHGGKEFYDEEHTSIVAKFLAKALR